jgi:hypothetical protein
MFNGTFPLSGIWYGEKILHYLAGDLHLEENLTDLNFLCAWYSFFAFFINLSLKSLK